MIEALIFDLDGTLVQTERLKAISYARAAVELAPNLVAEETVIEAFQDVVGRSRREVARALMERFALEEAARARMAELGAGSPWQAYVQVRLRIYEEMLADREILRSNQWPHAVALLHAARTRGCRTGLATMSHCPQARHILNVLELAEAFDVIATLDDVEKGKPDPEIYLLVSRELGVPPDRCLVIEDSPVGVEAALAAKMDVVAVSTPFTRRPLNESGLLPPERIVDDPRGLLDTVNKILRSSEPGREP